MVTTDGTELYFALEIEDQAETDDALHVRFDNDNDGVHTDGDDFVTLSPPGDFYDGNFSGLVTSYVGDLAVHGHGSVGQVGGTAFYELSHPLDSGDPDDIAIDLGDTVGLCLQYFDGGSASSGQPAGCVLAANHQANYLDVTVRLP